MANYISDKSTSGTDERISIVAKKKEYRDLDLSLELHPIRKDITPVRDSEAIKNAIRNILSTEMFERPFQPDLGASLKSILFENADALTETTLETLVESALVDNEPRINVIGVACSFSERQNAYRCAIKYIIKDIGETDTIEIKLRRLR